MDSTCSGSQKGCRSPQCSRPPCEALRQTARIATADTRGRERLLGVCLGRREPQGREVQRFPAGEYNLPRLKSSVIALNQAPTSHLLCVSYSTAHSADSGYVDPVSLLSSRRGSPGEGMSLRRRLTHR